MRRLVSLAFLVALPFVSLSAGAQEPGGTIAAAYAPEAALEICRGDNAVEAVECARKACAEASGFEPEYCVILAACENGNWSGVMGVMLQEVHFSTATCGSPSRAGVIAELKARCAAYAEFGMRECYMSRVYHPEGGFEEIETSWSAEDF